MELRSARCLRQGLLTSTALAGLGILPAAAGQLPTGYATSFGSVGFSRSSGTLNINQSSQSAIVNYNSFSIGRRARVDIHQPGASSVLLNRVTGATRSVIAGRLTANGQVYLINPNGIAITRSGAVKVGGGFVASSLGMTDEEFKSGRTHFSGGNAGRVSNRGTITIGRGGYAALIGGKVMNGGTIAVPMGTVAMGAGEMATLDVSGDGFLQVGLPSTAGGKGALITNTGRISGVTVMVDAATARAAARNVVNIAGTIDSHTISGHSGSIQIGGSGGTVAISGHLSVASRHATGGAVTITGDHIVMHHAHVMARGATGGGTVKIGGDFHGGGTLAHAGTVTIDKKSIITADATGKGNGGSVVVWSDETTSFAGLISAKGGAQGGDGGETEVSSHGKLAYTGWTVLTARRGAMGTLLLDPENVTISTAADAGQSGFTATADNSTINSTTLLKALSTANVTVSTGSTGGQAGTITLAANTPLAWTTGATLTLQAASDITLNSAVTAGAGGLTLTSGGTISATGAVSVARFILTSGNWVQNSATLPGFAAGDFEVNGGSFLRAAGGAGTTASPYLLTDIYGVQGMGTSTAYLAASYQLANNVDASGTAAWNGGLGFVPIGKFNIAYNTVFSGSLNGADYVISNLTINRPTEGDIGLFGYVYRAPSVPTAVTNLGLVGGAISGAGNVGSLVGDNFGGTITNAYSTATVTGSGSNVGGLIGYTAGGGQISQVYSTGAVTGGSGSQYVGGLVGRIDNGRIMQAYSTGAVTGGKYVGGFAGYTQSIITQAYSSGTVSGGSYVGGFTGVNGNYTSSDYWDTGIGGANAVGLGHSGGITGLSTAAARGGLSSYAGFDATIWYQAGDMRPILRSEAASAVNGVISVSNLDQLALMGANLSGSYALTGNLDASATNSTAASSGIWGAGGFVPIGSNSTPFKGSLNGAGHTITGLTINLPHQDYVGLIGYLGTGGRVSGLGLVGGSISGASFVGGLVGYNVGTVSRSYATGSVTGSDSVGGLVGENDYGGTVSQSYATGSVTGTSFVGGLVGANFFSVSESYATGRVTGSAYVGGLVGENNGSVSQSYATGSVSGLASVGGLVGDNSGTLTATYWDTQTTGQGNTGVGSGSSAGATGLTTAQARSQAGYSNLNDPTQNFDFANVWYQAGDMRPILRSEAASAVNGVIPVSNLDQLALMGANLSGSFVLTGNLDASATNSTAASAGIWGAGGFAPIGSNSTPFNGSLNGAGHTITGLTINLPNQDYVGLIGGLGSSGSVSGLGLVGVNVTGADVVGGLVGENGGTVSQSYATGSVSGSNAVGGLVGNNYNGTNYNDTNYNGTVSQSYATGSVSGFDEVGGLVGQNDNGTVGQSYATGNVVGFDEVGGLIGQNQGSVSQSYATGSVSGSTRAGGLIGVNSAPVTAVYWDISTNAAGTRGVGEGPAIGVIGLTTAQMTDLSAYKTNFAGFDFTNVWAPPNQAGQGGQSTAYYPQLRAFSNVLVVTPTTSTVYGATNPGLIATYTGLQPGDFVTNLGTLSSSATASSNVGSYAATASGTAVTAASGTAYRILYAPGTLQVTPASLTVSGTKVYDTSTGFGTGQLTVAGAQNSETVTLTAGTGTAMSADVGVYAGSVLSGLTITVSGGNGLASNYQLPATGTLAITPATITVAAATGVDKTYDGSTALPAGVPGFTSSGVLGNDAVTVTAASAAYTSANAGGEPFTVSGLTLSGAKAMDYTLSAMSVSGQGTITPRAVTLSGTQVYDGTTSVSASNVTVTNLVAGDTAGLSGTGAMTSRNVGTNALVSANGALTGFSLANGNYTLAGGSGSVNVTPEAITVTAAAGSKSYDGTSTSTATPTITTGAIQAGDTATLSERYGTANAGNGLTLTPTAVIADGNGGANYTVSYVGSSNGTITPRAVTLSGTQVYDGTTDVSASNLTVTNLVAGDTAGLGGTGTMTSRNAGSNGLVSANGALAGFTLANGNYTLAGGSGSVNVTPEAITVTAAAGSKTYDGTTTSTATPTITTGAIQAGDTATLSESYGTANAGSGLTLTPTAVIADGNGGANYTVSYVGSSNGTITPRAVTLSGTQVYDGTTDVSASNLTVTNLVAGDTAGLSGTGTMTSRNVGMMNGLASANGALTGFTLANGNYTLVGGSGSVAVTPEAITVTAAAGSKSYDGTTTSAATPTITTGAIQAGDTATLSESYATANAGTGLTLTPSAVIADGNGGANYTVTYVGSSTGTITPATLTYTASAATATYGSTPTGLTGTVSGFVDGQTAASATTGTLAFTTPATGSSNVGSYAIGGGGLTANDGNYVFAQAAGNATALTVTPAALTVSGTKTYNGTTGFATGQLAVSGGVNGETVSLTSGTGTTASADAGSYLGSSLSNLGILVSGGNAMASNYMLPSTGTLTIGKATITVAGATGVDKTYDGTTALPSGSSGFTTTGIVGNNASVAATSASYAGANAGSEAVNVTGLTIAGAGAGDYVLSSTSVQGSGTITPATVVVSANGGRSIYGNVPGNPGLSASGLQDGQNVGVLTGLSSSFAFTDRTHAGSYTLSVQGVMTNGNYRVVGANDGVFIVDPRALTVTADNQSRRFGQANPPLTYAIGGMGLVNGDTLAGALTTPAMKDSRGGAYAIQQGTLAASSDYALTYVPGTLVVGPAPLTVTSGASIVTPASTISAAGLASTAERADQQVLGLLDGSLPLSSSTVGDIGATGAKIVGSLTNPRFDEIVVCVKDLCTFAAPRPKPPMKQSSLENPR